MDLVVFLGYPGCSKGTQAEIASQRAKYVHISTGDDLRNAPPGSALYHVYRGFKVGEANFAPDADMFRHVTRKVIDHRFSKGIILDGFPRNVEQAYLFDSFLEILAPNSFRVVHLDVNRQTAKDRLIFRYKTKNREDDSSLDKINLRLNKYENETAKILDYYKSKGMFPIRVDASLSIGEISSQIEKIIIT